MEVKDIERALIAIAAESEESSQPGLVYEVGVMVILAAINDDKEKPPLVLPRS